MVSIMPERLIADDDDEIARIDQETKEKTPIAEHYQCSFLGNNFLLHLLQERIERKFVY